ncbi:hypothetical protein DL98DRAFT_514760 [Cadophora sp. DSE1049]|nr:hypothetical protein DL98DRAFT_514760 [Cadophora sp. DSE1049]
MDPTHQALPNSTDNPVATNFPKFNDLPQEFQDIIWGIFLEEEEDGHDRFFRPFGSYDPPMFCKIDSNRRSQAKTHYAEFRIPGTWRSDYTHLFRPRHDVLHISEKQHIGRFRTAIIFALREPKIRGNLKKIMFSPKRWVFGRLSHPMLDALLKHIDIVASVVVERGEWEGSDAFRVVSIEDEGIFNGKEIEDLTYVRQKVVLTNHFARWGEHIPKIRAVKMVFRG